MSSLPQPLLQAEKTPLLGPDALRLREVLDALCLSDDDEVAGRALLRRAQLRLAQADLALSRLEGERAGPTLMEAIDDATAAGPRLDVDSDHGLQARFLAARLLLRLDDRGTAEELVLEARAAVKGKHKKTRLMLAMAEGELALEGGEPGDAVRQLRRALGLARSRGTAHDHHQAAVGLAAAARLQGDTEGAASWYRLARKTATSHGDRHRQATACFALSTLLTELKDPAGSLEALEEAVEAGLVPTFQSPALLGLAQIHHDIGQFQEGLRRAMEAARSGVDAGDGEAFASATVITARCLVGLELEETALETLDAGEEVLVGKGYADLAAMLRAQREEILSERG